MITQAQAKAQFKAQANHRQLFTLPDGGEVLVREAIPEDARGLRDMFARCSHEPIYLRFHLPLPTVPEWAIELLAGAGDVHRDRQAVVAMDDDGGIAGHAMYARQGAREAEMAIVVENRQQSRGIGKLLLARLAEEAGRRGIEAFTGTVLGENRGALRFFSSVLSKAQFKIRGGVYHLYVPLPSPEAVRGPKPLGGVGREENKKTAEDEEGTMETLSFTNTNVTLPSS